MDNESLKQNSSLYFNFVPKKIHDDLLSSEFSIRLNASNDLSKMAENQSINVLKIDIKNFFQFAKPLLTDVNFGVVNNIFEVIDFIVTKLDSNIRDYESAITDIVLPPLRDKRRAVRSLSSNLILKFSQLAHRTSLLEYIIAMFYNQPTTTQIDILEITGKVLTTIDEIPSTFSQNIISLIENAILIVNVTVHNTAERLLKQIKDFNPDIFKILPEDMKKLAESQNPTMGTVRLPQTPTSALPKLKNKFQFKPPETSNAKKRSDSFWYHSKPRFAKTAGFIINKNGQLSFNIPQTKPFTGNPRFAPEAVYDMASSGDDYDNYESMHVYDQAYDTSYDKTDEEFDNLENAERIYENFDDLPQIEPQVKIEREFSPTPPPVLNSSRRNNKQNIVNNKENEINMFVKKHNDFLNEDKSPESSSLIIAPIVNPNKDDSRRISKNEESPKDLQNPSSLSHSNKNTSSKKEVSIHIPEFTPDDTSLGDIKTPSPPKEAQSIKPKRKIKIHPPSLLIPETQPLDSIISSQSHDVQESPEELQIKQLNVKKRNFRKIKFSSPIKKPSPSQETKTDISSILTDMQSTNEWERQSDAISKITKLVSTNKQFILSNLRVISFEMIPLCSSIRSALSKSALECFTLIASNFGNEMTPFFEAIVNDLLTILLSSKGFISRLASTCITTILKEVNRKKAIDYLSGDHKRRPGSCKALLSSCLEEICCDVDDPNQIIPSVNVFITDANPEARKHARSAVQKIQEKFPDFSSMVNNSSIDESGKKAILSAITDKSK